MRVPSELEVLPLRTRCAQSRPHPFQPPQDRSAPPRSPSRTPRPEPSWRRYHAALRSLKTARTTPRSPFAQPSRPPRRTSLNPQRRSASRIAPPQKTRTLDGATAKGSGTAQCTPRSTAHHHVSACAHSGTRPSCTCAGGPRRSPADPATCEFGISGGHVSTRRLRSRAPPRICRRECSASAAHPWCRRRHNPWPSQTTFHHERHLLRGEGDRTSAGGGPLAHFPRLASPLVARADGRPPASRRKYRLS